MTASTVAGVDVGTTRVRVGLWDPAGRPAFLDSRPTPYRPGPGGLPGVDVPTVVDLTAELLRAGVLRLGAPPVAVGIASMAEVGVPLDAGGTPLAPGVPWNRAPGSTEADTLVRQLGAGHLYRTTGLRPEPKHTLVTWLWLRRTHPELLAGMHRWAGIADAVAAALTGSITTVASLACRTLAFDLATGDWSPELAAQAGLSVDVLPDLRRPGEPAGGLTTAAAGRTGLPAGTPVVVAGHDHPVGAWGAGVTAAGQFADSAGTAEVAIAPVAAVDPDERLRRRGFSVGCFVDGDQRYVLGSVPSAGALIDWLIDLLRLPAGDEAFPALAELLPDGPRPPGELVVEPYPAGRGAPLPDRDRRLAVHGVGLQTGPGDLAEALLTAVGCQLRWILAELAAATGVTPSSVTSYGGALRLPGWIRRRAAINPWPTRQVSHRETVSLGAACLAAHAGGEDLRAPAAVPVPAEPALRATYEAYYQERFLATARPPGPDAEDSAAAGGRR